MRTMEQIGFFTGLGVVLVLISAAVACGSPPFPGW